MYEKENRKRSLTDVTALFNRNRESAVSKRTVQRTLYKQEYFRRIVWKHFFAQSTTPKFSLMIWGCDTFNGVGTITVVDVNINEQKVH